jgi:hypothetical protein
MSYDMEDFRRDCYAFNSIAGKDKGTEVSDLIKQYDLIHEEVLEICEGIIEDNPKEVLDGAMDVLVTTFGLLQKLERLGMDVQLAMVKTAGNNMSKFVRTHEEAIDTVNHYAQQGINTFAEFNPTYGMYVIKDLNHKVRKPISFVSNDLSDCIPDELELGFKEEDYENT